MVEGRETMEVDESRCDKALRPYEINCWCDTALRPYEINYCRLPCPGHCVVTNWSAWSNCTQVNTLRVCVCVSVGDERVRCRTAGRIEMPFGAWSHGAQEAMG